MVCYRIKNGLNLCGYNYTKRWVQRVVLINKSDVTDVVRDDNVISFSLSGSGQAFEMGTGNSILGNCETIAKNGYAQFKHNVQMPFVSFTNNMTLIDVVRGEYFAALMDGYNRVWIFGYDYTLRAQDDLIDHIEVDILTLRSDDSGLEDVPPLRFYSDDPVGDFYNNFENLPEPILGEFSDDFSLDFNI